MSNVVLLNELENLVSSKKLKFNDGHFFNDGHLVS